MFQKIIVAYVYLLSMRGRIMCNVLLVDSFLNASSFPKIYWIICMNYFLNKLYQTEVSGVDKQLLFQRWIIRV